MDYARKLIKDGKRREDGADLFKVGRDTLYQALARRSSHRRTTTSIWPLALRHVKPAAFRIRN